MPNRPASIPATQMRTPGPLGQDTKANNERFLKDLHITTNKYRKMHGCPELTISPELNKLAQEWANVSSWYSKSNLDSASNLQHLRDKNIMEHRPKPKYGENIFLSGGMDVTGDLPVDMWYREINAFNFNNPDFVPTAGHFTQLIWKASREMGSGVARKWISWTLFSHVQSLENLSYLFFSQGGPYMGCLQLQSTWQCGGKVCRNGAEKIAIRNFFIRHLIQFSISYL